jgi:hypothetical protein
MLPLPGKLRIRFLLKALLYLFLIPQFSIAQEAGLVKGKVLDEAGSGIENALIIFLPGGNPAFSDSSGFFTVERPAGATELLISANGFKKQTLTPKSDRIEIRLQSIPKDLSEIRISGERNPGQFDYKSAYLSINIDQQELRKAACCNLSESFESSPMVDVSFPDPISGVRQIKMMGLSSQYTGYSIENQTSPSGV